MIRSAITSNNVKATAATLVNNFTKPILFRRNIDQLEDTIDHIDFEATDNRPNTKQKNIDIKEAFAMKPLEFNKEELIINEDTLKTNKNRIVAMPFEYNYTNFYKNKRSTNKKFIEKRKHLRDFGTLPHIFPESMFRDYYMQPIPLSKVQEGNVDK